MYSTLCIIGLLLVLATVQAQPREIASNSRLLSISNALAIAPIGSPNACSDSFYVLTNTTTNCVNTLKTNGSIINSTCPAALVGAQSVSCSDGLCFVLNPATNSVVALNLTTGITTTFGSTLLTRPMLITSIKRNTTHHAVLVVEYNTTNTLVWLFWSTLAGVSSAATTTNIVNVASPNRPTGVYFKAAFPTTVPPTAHFFLTWENTPTISNYSTNGALLGSWGSFGNIQFATGDMQDRAFIYDSTCSCVKIFSPSGVWINTINLASAPLFLVPTRNNVFVVDSAGILMYSDPIVLTHFSYENSTCPARGATAYMASYGGAYPLQYKIYPDQVNVYRTNYNSSNATLAGMQPPVLPIYPYIVANETVAGELFPVSASITAVPTPTAVFPAYSGNYSQRLTFTAKSTYWYQSCYGCVDNTRYTNIEFYMNPLNSNMSFSVWAGSYNMKIMKTTTELTANAWNKITLDFSDAPVTKQQIIFIRAEDGVGFPITVYIDDYVLVPYNLSTPRVATIIDYCGSRLNYGFEAWEVNPMSFSVQTTSPSCNAKGNNPEKSLDGTATVAVQNGVGPFTYTWSFSNTTTNFAAGLPAIRTAITIYDNAINASFGDASTASGRKFNDSSRYVSPPFSMSMVPTEDLQSLSFLLPAPISTAEYPQIEFWVNGGPTGNQPVSLLIQRYTKTVDNVGVWSLFGLPSIPPNMWKKATYRHPTVTTFTSVTLQFIGNLVVGPIYFDDLKLIPNTVLTVSDSTGCSVTTADVNVPAPSVLVGVPTVENAKCYNSTDGSFAVEVSGGSAPYTYTWSITSSEDLGSSETTDDIGETDVEVNVTDAKGCTLPPLNFAVLQPNRVSFIKEVTPAQCNGGLGTISVQAVGGVAPYTYSWVSNNGYFFPRAEPAPSPAYLDSFYSGFSLKSGNMPTVCRGTGSLTHEVIPPSRGGYCSLMPSFSALSPNISISACPLCLDVDKFGGITFWVYFSNPADAASISISLWKDGVSVSKSSPLSELGTIVANWSQVLFNFSEGTTVERPEQITLISSNPDNMGTIYIDEISIIPKAATNVGFSTYSGYASLVIGNADTYLLTVVDGNGCTTSTTISIVEPDAIAANAQVTQPSSTLSEDGAITLNATGGTPPYTIRWVDFQNSSAISQSLLSAGEYQIEITDANGCVLATSVFLSPSGDKIYKAKEFSTGLSGGLGALVGVGVVIFIFAMVLLTLYKGQFSTHGYFYSSILLFGIAISYVSALTLLPKPTDTLCTAFPWLLGIGFNLVYGCLFIKTWALYTVWRNASQMKRTHMTPFYIAKVLSVFVLVEVVFLVIWTVVSPPKVKMNKMVDDTLMAQCDSDTEVFWIIFLCAKGVWMLFGAVLSILTRNIAKEYNNSTSIAYAIYNNVVLAVIAVPLAVLLKNVPGGQLVIIVAIIFLAFTFTMCIMFFKSWHSIIFGVDVQLNLGPRSGGSSKTTPTQSRNTGSKGSKNSSDGNSSTTAPASISMDTRSEKSVVPV